MKKIELGLIKVLEVVCGICFVVMFTLIVTQVALRYGFNESIGGANELATILFAYTSALGIAIGIARRDHMAISWFTERLRPRARKTIDVIALILLALLNAVLEHLKPKKRVAFVLQSEYIHRGGAAIRKRDPDELLVRRGGRLGRKLDGKEDAHQ